MVEGIKTTIVRIILRIILEGWEASQKEVPEVPEGAE